MILRRPGRKTRAPCLSLCSSKSRLRETQLFRELGQDFGGYLVCAPRYQTALRHKFELDLNTITSHVQVYNHHLSGLNVRRVYQSSIFHILERTYSPGFSLIYSTSRSPRVLYMFKTFSRSHYIYQVDGLITNSIFHLRRI